LLARRASPETAGWLRNAAANSSAAEVTPDELRIWFSTKRGFEESLSDDQDLGTHRVMCAEDGEIALTFDLDALTPAEVRSLG
jgi:arginase family enzyme